MRILFTLFKTEENISDTENVATIDVSSEKDTSLLQTPSARRQKAALRAAKQAEHKRLI